MPGDEVLKVVISASDQATDVIKRVSSSLMDMKGAAIAAGAALGALTLKKSIDAFTDFQSAMKQSIAIMGNVSKEMEEALMRKALDVANHMAVSQEEVARAYYYLASAGLSAKESLEAVTEVAKLAVAAHMDMAEATDIAVNTMKAFGLTVQDLTRINDTLIATVTKSNTNLQQLGEAMKYVAPFAHQVGWSLEEVSAALGILANHGIKASQAGTYLRQAIAQLINPTDSAKEAMERLGLTVEDLNPETHSLAEILQELQDAGASTADIMEIFGVRAGSAIAVLMQEGAPALRQFTQEIKNSGDITDEVVKKQQEAFSEQWKIFENNLRTLAITIGSVVVPALNDMLQPLIRILQAFNDLPEPIQKATGAFIALGATLMMVAGAVKVISGVMSLLGMGGLLSSITGAIGGLTGALGGLGAVTGALSGAFSALTGALAAVAGAISLPIVVIGLLIAAIVALIFNIGGFRDKVIKALTWVGEHLVKFGKLWLKWWLKLHAPVLKAMHAIWNAISPYVAKVVAKLRELGRRAWEAVSTAFSRLAQPVKDAMNRMFNAVASIKDKIANALKSAWERAINYIRGLPSKFWDYTLRIGKAIVNGLVAGVAGLARALWDKVVSPVRSAVDTLKDLLDIHSPSGVFEEIGKAIVEGYARGLATAEKIQPTLPMPEIHPAFISGSYPSAPTPAGPRMPPQVNVTIHVNQTNARPEDIADAVRRALEREIGEW